MNLLVACLISFSTMSSSDVIRVDITDFPPLIIKNKNDTYGGFEIELWEEIARDLNLEFEYNYVEFDNIFNNILSNKSDIAIAGLSITSAREDIVDFTHPTLNSGYLIAIRSNEGMLLNKIKNIWFDSELKKVIICFVLFLCTSSILVWLCERTRNDNISKSFIHGLYDTFWCMNCTVTTIGYGDISAKTPLGRFLSLCVMYTGIFFLSITFSVISQSYAKSSEYDIKSRHDLTNKIITAVRNTSAKEEIEKLNGKLLPANNETQMIEYLLAGDAEAILFDASWVQHYTRDCADIQIIGDVFSKHHYGFAISQSNAELKSSINKSLLKLRERGVYDQIYDKWFDQNVD